MKASNTELAVDENLILPRFRDNAMNMAGGPFIWETEGPFDVFKHEPYLSIYLPTYLPTYRYLPFYPHSYCPLNITPPRRQQMAPKTGVFCFSRSQKLPELQREPQAG